ncbi:hypothetical protein CEXT_661831 [Caerostris extrusa]|uniref:Uncharacterized protein n=1 Tax=Caerostris extrusa TaxID=172846 RepID=A0AAV4UQB4_CAEEX|nr:hypothetical protein CEXT_661831 [Caerostris extrusa]
MFTTAERFTSREKFNCQNIRIHLYILTEKSEEIEFRKCRENIQGNSWNGGCSHSIKTSGQRFKTEVQAIKETLNFGSGIEERNDPTSERGKCTGFNALSDLTLGRFNSLLFSFCKGISCL